MSSLRKRTHLSYYEPEEPSFDEYLYCERCADFVYDYCAIHGPLLVVPDNKVCVRSPRTGDIKGSSAAWPKSELTPPSTRSALGNVIQALRDHVPNSEVPVKSNVAPCVPRAALTIPHVFLHLAPSIIPGAGLGVFSTLTLPRGVRFGPYCGLRTQNVNSMYCWQIYDSNNKRSHVLDAVDCDHSNWMRYVNCARHWKEQNLLAYQYKGQLYYRTIKIIPRYTELMVFYGSEFANALHINLSKYNSAKYYKEIIGTPTQSLQENKEVGMQEDYLTADQFHFIDENVDEDDNNKNSTKIDINSNIQSTKIDDSSCKETACSETKEECKENTPTIRYECETCQKTFATTRTLKEHALTHLNTWKFNCEYCIFRSNKHYNFKLHVGKHTNTFKFSCEKCPFKTNYGRTFRKHCFRHKSSEKILENISPGDKVNFPAAKICEICDFKANSRKVFATHMSKHKGNVYKCDNCSYSNHSKYNLSRHIARLRH